MVVWIALGVEGSLKSICNFGFFDLDKSALIEQLLNDTFRRLENWRQPKFLPSKCPQTEKPFLDFKTEVRDRKAQARKQLEGLEERHLQASLSPDGVPSSILNSPEIQSINQLRSDIKSIRLPQWWYGGFSVQGHEPDFEHWVRLPRWSKEDAISLSVGYEPTDWLFYSDEFEKLPSEIFQFLRKRIELVVQTFFSKPNPHEYITPSQFCDWAYSMKLDIDEALYVAMNNIRETNYSVLLFPENRMEDRERNSLLKLVIGLAIGAYRYKPDAQRSDVPKSIRGDLAEIGLDLSEDTIRKWLREAATTLPKGWKGE